MSLRRVLVRTLIVTSSALAFVALPKVASATPNGSDSGCSGKTGIPNDVCTSCGNCHTGGPAPSVAFAGPATLNSGAVATYTFTVNTSLPATGVDVAATDGVTLTHGANTQNAFGELTQPSPQPTSAGATTYSFTVTGPQYAGTIELWGSGMASNNNGGTGGDGASNTTMMITVVGPPNPTGGGATGPVDAGSGVGPTGGFFPDGGAKDVDPPGVDLPDASAGANGLAPDDVLHQQSGSCNVSRTLTLGSSDSTNSRSGTGMLAAGLVMGALVLTRRRRR